MTCMTRKDIQRYYTIKCLIRYIYSAKISSNNGAGAYYLRTSRDILQFLSLDWLYWFTGHVIRAHIPGIKTMAGVPISENSRGAQILQLFGSLRHRSKSNPGLVWSAAQAIIWMFLLKQLLPSRLLNVWGSFSQLGATSFAIYHLISCASSKNNR